MKLEQFRNTLQSTLKQNSDLFYPHTLEFRLSTYAPWPLRCRVKQPANPKDESLLQRMVQDFGPNHRLVYAHPDDLSPVLGARAPFQGGLLEIVSVGEYSDYVGKCVLAAVYTS